MSALGFTADQSPARYASFSQHDLDLQGWNSALGGQQGSLAAKLHDYLPSLDAFPKVDALDPALDLTGGVQLLRRYSLMSMWPGNPGIGFERS